jgi:hypothetical protein
MARAGEVTIRMRIVIEQPVAGVLHSMQEDDAPLHPKQSTAGEPLAFDFSVRVTPATGETAPKFSGKQVRREGKERRFVYVRIGTAAGDPASPWSRKMKIDIHDVDPALLEQAMAGQVLEGRLNGTARDGSPACATIRPVTWRVLQAAGEQRRVRPDAGARVALRAARLRPDLLRELFHPGGRCS